MVVTFSGRFSGVRGSNFISDHPAAVSEFRYIAPFRNACGSHMQVASKLEFEFRTNRGAQRHGAIFKPTLVGKALSFSH